MCMQRRIRWIYDDVTCHCHLLVLLLSLVVQTLSRVYNHQYYWAGTVHTVS